MKKTSLLLCLTIHTPFHPGEYGNDGSPPLTHHEAHTPPIASCMESSDLSHGYTPTASSPSHLHSATSKASLTIQASSSSAISFQAIFSNNGIITLLLLPPLRGSNSSQDRQKQFQPQDAVKTKTKMIQMGLLYMNKELLDPG